MKNHLLKITSLTILSCGLMLTACSESDNDTENTNNNEIVEEEAIVDEKIIDEPAEETPPTDTENPNDSTVMLTDICMFCPAYSIQQSSVSNPVAITISEPDGTICKGEDGKAYIDGVLNENNLSYEDYLQVRQMILRCSDL